jgi:preprotein translocase subunit SecD
LAIAGVLKPGAIKCAAKGWKEPLQTKTYTLTSLLLISGCLADELVVLNSATASHDERTGKPILKLIFAETSKERLRSIFGTENLGQMVELRVDGRVVLSPVLREPLTGVQMQISDPSWTDQAVIDLAQQLSEAPKGEIELRPSSSSK